MDATCTVPASSVSPEPERSFASFTDKRCSICGASRLLGGACSLVSSGTDRGCPDPTYDFRRERAEAFAAYRESLISNLLYASRDLASWQVRAAFGEQGEILINQECLECHFAAQMGVLHHAASCRTGRVLDLIGKICAAGVVGEAVHAHAPSAEVQSNSIRKETAQEGDRVRVRARAGIPVRGSDEVERRTRPVDFKEPVSYDRVAHIYRDSNGDFIDLENREAIAAWHKRVAACMNFCADIPMSVLEAQKPLTDLTRDIQEQICAARILRGDAREKAEAQ